MANTAKLSLPFLEASQKSEHVTVNDALQSVDAVVQLSVLDRDASTPPGSPVDGDRYLVPSGATAAWDGWDDSVAYFAAGAWHRLQPNEGWLAWVEDEGLILVYENGAWREYLQNLDMIGVNATADATNRLSVSSAAILLNHAGAGHQVKVNKAGAGDTASLLFQTGFSGRAEMGTAGNDDWSIKVSSDGSTWTEALRINALTGLLSGAAVQSGPEDTTPGRALLNEAHGLGSFTGGVLSQPDANDAFPCGFYGGGGSGASNFPGAAAFRPFLVLNRRSNSYNYMTARIFIDTDATPVVRESIDSGATWSP
uniref:DUF2793 domain-containing protein n=1 Tax=Roseovarius halophilus (ex Wu et al. 2025) TaxID=3376060 RepID=UPI0039997A99